MIIHFKHPETGETRTVRQGFNFVYFFFGGFFGIPLYANGLNGLGNRFLLLNFFIIMNAFGLLPWVRTENMQIINYLLLNVCGIILAIYAGANGNSLLMLKYHKEGFHNYIPKRQETIVDAPATANP